MSVPDVARVPLPAERFRFLVSLARRGAAQMRFAAHPLRELLDADLITCVTLPGPPALPGVPGWVEVELTSAGRHVVAQHVAWQQQRNAGAWWPYTDADIASALQANGDGLTTLSEPELSRAIASVRRGFPLAHAIAVATGCRCYCEWCAR